MPTPREVLTPDALSMIEAIASTGSFAGAARQLGLVPSALTYRVRSIEDALDVLLFDRSARQARVTPAGAELLREGSRLLGEIDAIANRVRRVATGWEPEFTIAADTVISRLVLMELAEQFYALNPPTRVRICDEALAGTLEALTSGKADLAIGVVLDPATTAGVQSRQLGSVEFVFAVAPHHPLADAKEPLDDRMLLAYRFIAVADSIRSGAGMTVGLLSGQDVFTVSSMQTKLEAQLRGLGVGYLPEPMARPYIEAGRLVVKKVDRTTRLAPMSYAWRVHSARTGDNIFVAPAAKRGEPTRGRALSWWLERLETPATREALLNHHLRV